MFRLSFRYLRSHWQLNLIIFLAVFMGATLAATLPMYTRMVADEVVQTTLAESTIAQRNLTLSGNVQTGTVNKVDQELGQLLRDRREFSMTRISLSQQIFRPNETIEETLFSAFFADVWSVDPLQSEVTLVEGRWPTSSPIVDEQGLLTQITLEVAVGNAVASSEDINLNIGDKLRLDRSNVELEIVGLVEPRDPKSEIWFGDETLLRFQDSRFVDASINIDEMRLGILMPMPLVEAFVTQTSEWRYLLAHDTINASNMGDIHTQLQGIVSQEGSSTERIRTQLIEILDRLIAEQAQSRAVLYLLLIQSLLAILYTLVLLTRFAIEQAEQMLSTLIGRGFNRIQLTRMFALSSGLLFFGVALPLAPMLAFGLMRLWRVSQPGLPTVALPTSSLILAIGVVVICWLMVIITVYIGTQHNLLHRLQRRARKSESDTGRVQLVIELFILATGALAYWQLQNSGERFEMTQVETRLGGGDPILLLAPTLLLLAIGLLSLRLVPFLLRFIAKMGQRSRSFLAPIGLLRLSRDTTLSTQVILLITFTVALSLFAIVIRGSLIQRQHEIAHYVTGADLRIRLSLDKQVADNEISQIINTPSVKAASHVVRGRSILSDPAENTYINARFLAVEPETLPNVTFYPSEFSPFSLNTVVSILNEEDDDDGVLPIVLGSNRQTLHMNRGDRFQLIIGRSTIEVEVVGIIETFPSINENFVITNLHLLEQRTDIEDPTLDNKHIRELWLDVAAGQQSEALGMTESLSSDLFFTRVLGDTVVKAETFQKKLIVRQSTAAMQINTIVFLILSAIGFLTIQYFGAKQRFAEYGVMQALGVGRKAWFRLISAEAIATLIVGTVLGLILGTILSFMMRPLLISLLTASTGNNRGIELIFSPSTIAQMLGLLALTYGAAVIILNRMLRRIELQKQLRFIQE